MRIVFVTDGSLALGMGHVQQSTTLARRLREAAEVSFLTKSAEPVVDKIGQAGFAVARLADDAAILRGLQASPPDVVVFDKVDVDEALARDIRATVQAGLVIFTNLTRANDHAHVAVTAGIGSRHENLSYRDERTGTQTYFGPKYWILGPEFYDLAAKGRAPTDAVRRVLLIFGGSDPCNLTAAALGALLESGNSLHLDVVLGAHFGWDAEVASVLAAHASRRDDVTLLRNISDVAQRMYAADLVLASPGLSAVEALCVGSPVILLPQNEMGREAYRDFFRMVERDEVAQLPDMIERRDFTRPTDPQIARMEIGQGISELVSVILRLGTETRA